MKICDNCKFYERVDAKKFYCNAFNAFFIDKKEICEEYKKKKV